MLCGSSSKRLLFVTGSNGSNTQPEHRATLNSPESATRALFRTAPRKRRSSKCRFPCARHYCLTPLSGVQGRQSGYLHTVRVALTALLQQIDDVGQKPPSQPRTATSVIQPGSGHKPDMAATAAMCQKAKYSLRAIVSPTAVTMRPRQHGHPVRTPLVTSVAAFRS